MVNYEDPNYNISIPVFSIHGNHDDPAGEGLLAALDLLSATNLVNYFGKTTSVDQIDVHPILIQKGNTRVALYGMGYVRDERLFRAFSKDMVKFYRPEEGPETWFNILVLHQNRIHRSPKNYVSENVLPDFMDLIVWGHEHECRIKPEPSEMRRFHITQPGSSIATSLSFGESQPKHVGLLEICGKNKYRIKPQRLKTVRPLMFKDIVLAEEESIGDKMDREAITALLTEAVQELVQQVQDASASVENPRHPKEPLIRLRVDYTGGFATPHPQRFGQQFVGIVANPCDILRFHRSAQQRGSSQSLASSTMSHQSTRPQPLNGISISSVISSCLEDMVGKDAPLAVLQQTELDYALRSFVEKDDGTAFESMMKVCIENIEKELTTADSTQQISNAEQVDQLLQDRQSRLLAEQELENASMEAQLATETDNASRHQTKKEEDSENPDEGDLFDEESDAGALSGHDANEMNLSEEDEEAQSASLSSSDVRSRSRSRSRSRASSTAQADRRSSRSTAARKPQSKMRARRVTSKTRNQSLLQDDDAVDVDSSDVDGGPSYAPSQVNSSAASFPPARSSKRRRNSNVDSNDTSSSTPFPPPRGRSRARRVASSSPGAESSLAESPASPDVSSLSISPAYEMESSASTRTQAISQSALTRWGRKRKAT